jgi:hypothetical protein
MRHFNILAAALVLSCLLAGQAHASFFSKTPVLNEPDTISLGIGWFDFNDHWPRQREAVDFRLEYRTAFDMLGLINAHNAYIAIRPFVGVEANSDSWVYGLWGFLFDVPIGKHFVVTPSLAMGWYDKGGGKYLGATTEFRSTFEAGYKFDDGSRITASVGHISNAGQTQYNPGTEIVDVYYHLPISKIFGK